MPEVLYEEVLEVDERVVLYRGEPGAGTPVKGAGASGLGARGQQGGPLTDGTGPPGRPHGGPAGGAAACGPWGSAWEAGGTPVPRCPQPGRGAHALLHVSMAWPGLWAVGRRPRARGEAPWGRHYRWAQHEQQVGALARELGFTHVSLSSDTMPMVRIVPRGHTACADAYLTPTIQRYVQGFRRGFQGQLKVRPPAGRLRPPHPCLPGPLTGCRSPTGRAGAVHALRWWPGAHGVLQRLPGCALWPCWGCGWLLSHHLPGGRRPARHRL